MRGRSVFELDDTARETLAALAVARTDWALLESAADLARVWTGASKLSVVTRDNDRPAATSLSVVLGDTPPAIRLAGLSTTDAMRRGEPLFFHPGGFHALDHVPAAGCSLLAVVPASGPGSRTALIVEWTGEPPRPTKALGDSLGLIAVCVGLALRSLDAERLYRASQSEMENRIRNTIAVIRTLATRSAEPAELLEEYALHFDGRLDAVARVQAAFAGARRRVDLEALVLDELFGSGIAIGDQAAVRGMSVGVSRAIAEPLCLAIHELSTNAAKFGPFSGRGGSMTLRWWLETSESVTLLSMFWNESCDVPLSPGPVRFGFGRAFVTRALPFELNAKTSFEITAKGFSCSIEIPLDRQGQSALRHDLNSRADRSRSGFAASRVASKGQIAGRSAVGAGARR